MWHCVDSADTTELLFSIKGDTQCNEKEPHGVRQADCTGKRSAQNGLMRYQHTLTHIHTRQALNPTPKHLFQGIPFEFGD